MHTPLPRLPKKPTLCTCKVGNGVRSCQRDAVVLVGFNGFCAQHAKAAGVTIPSAA